MSASRPALVAGAARLRPQALARGRQWLTTPPLDQEPLPLAARVSDLAPVSPSRATHALACSLSAPLATARPPRAHTLAHTLADPPNDVPVLLSAENTGV